MKKINAYMSHPIRGKLGNNASDRVKEQNRQRATVVGKILKILFPILNLYVPAEHDEFVRRTHRKKYLTEQQILEIDCEILKECDLLILYNWQHYLSEGMVKEINCARENNIKIFSFTQFNERVIDELKDILKELENDIQ